jgi:hypothetical protein
MRHFEAERREERERENANDSFALFGQRACRVRRGWIYVDRSCPSAHATDALDAGALGDRHGFHCEPGL